MNSLVRGVSIAETLVAIFLLTLVLMVLFNLFPTTILANRQGTQRLQALTMAQSILAEAKAVPFDSLVVDAPEAASSQTIDSIVYVATQRVESVEGTDSDRLKIVTVNVQWQVENIERSVTEQLWVHSKLSQ